MKVDRPHITAAHLTQRQRSPRPKGVLRPPYIRRWDGNDFPPGQQLHLADLAAKQCVVGYGDVSRQKKPHN